MLSDKLLTPARGQQSQGVQSHFAAEASEAQAGPVQGHAMSQQWGLSGVPACPGCWAQGSGRQVPSLGVEIRWGQRQEETGRTLGPCKARSRKAFLCFPPN